MYKNLIMGSTLLQDVFNVDARHMIWAAEYLSNAGVPKDSKILDCGAGTGLVAEALRGHHGFTGQIDGLDASKEMLAKAEEKDIYNELIWSFIGDGNTIPIDDGKLFHIFEICFFISIIFLMLTNSTWRK